MKENDGDEPSMVDDDDDGLDRFTMVVLEEREREREREREGCTTNYFHQYQHNHNLSIHKSTRAVVLYLYKESFIYAS